MKIRNNISNLCIYAIVCVFYFYIAYQIPYTGDDWDWGLDIGLQHLLTADINSRYAGNLMVVIMTRSKLMQTLIMGMAFFLIPFLMANLAFKRNGQNDWQFTILFVAANILMLSMDKRIWQQTYGWVSGFANYGISVVMVLIYLHLVDSLFSDIGAEKKHSLLEYTGEFLLGMVMQLFIENLALAMVILSVSICMISYLRMGKVGKEYLVLLAGNLLGLIIMFSSKIYPALLGLDPATDGLRDFSFERNAGIWDMLKTCMSVFAKDLAWQLWERNIVICCGISVLLIVLFVVRYPKDLGKLEYSLLAVDILSIPYFVVFSYLEIGKYFLQNYGLMDLAELVVNVGFFLVVAVQLAVLYRDRKWAMWKLLVLWVCAPLVILPMSAVDIEGGRFFITSNCFEILVMLHLLLDCLTGLSKKAMNLMMALSLSILLSFSLFYTFLYREIGGYTRQRMEVIEEAKETDAKDIVLPAYPYSVSDYIWWAEPGFEYREVYFREFFGLDPDVNMTFVQE